VFPWQTLFNACKLGQEPTLEEHLGALDRYYTQLSSVHTKLQVFVPGKPFQPSLVFAGKAGAYPSESTFQVLHSKVGS
jgi:hypothetical protein